MKATIVAPLFDRSASVIEMLKALNSQTAGSKVFEVILIDDSGKERIAREILRCVNTSFDVSVKRTFLPYEVNGVSVARNIGIRSARGGVIISIDDDCIPNPYFVEEHLSFHRSDPPCIVLGHRSERSEILKEARPVPVTETKAVRELRASNAGALNFLNFVTGNVSVPKSIAVQAGFFDERFAQRGEHGWEDIELGYRLWRLGYQTVFARNAVVYRPPTEREKEEKRAVTQSVEKGRKRLLSLQPQISRIIEMLKAILAQRKDVVVDIAGAVLRNDPQNCAVLATLGDVCLSSGRYTDALGCYVKAETANSNYAVFRERIAETLLHIEKAPGSPMKCKRSKAI